MPLVRFDMIKGRTEQEITKILDVCHKVFVQTLQIPHGDRYQVVHQHEPYEMIIKDTGLGFERSEKVIVISILSRERTIDSKKDLYATLVSELEKECGIAPNDVMISFSINEDENWSFGFGRAQFLTGEL